jgi:hypothetical protein
MSEKFVGMSKKALILNSARTLFLCVLAFASFTASLYLPHQNPWWRVSEIFMAALFLWGPVSRYYQRTVHSRKEQQPQQLDHGQ